MPVIKSFSSTTAGTRHENISQWSLPRHFNQDLQKVGAASIYIKNEKPFLYVVTASELLTFCHSNSLK